MTATDMTQAVADEVPPATPHRTHGWDPLVKLTHWGIALAVLANGLFTEDGSDWHIWVGTGMAALLAVRLLWGLVGPREARFSAFPPNPFRALSHIRDILAGRKVQHRSHNPLGALMAYSLWGVLAVVAATGFAMSGLPGLQPVQGAAGSEVSITRPLAQTAAEADEDEEDHAEDEGRSSLAAAGPEARADGEGQGSAEWIEEVHEVAANLLFVLAALHIAGVLFETRRMGRAVLGRMTGGRSG